MLVLALLLAIDDHPPGPLTVALLVTGTVVSVTCAEAYADLLGMEIDLKRPTTRGEKRSVIRELSVMAVAAEWPVLVFVASGFGLLPETLAFRLAVWGTVALLFVDGFFARRLHGGSVPASLRSALVAGGIGVALAIFKHFVHG